MNTGMQNKGSDTAGQHPDATKESKLMTCNHHPVITFKVLFARNATYICKDCGATIELTARFKTISKIINGLTIGFLVYQAFKGSGATSGTAGSTNSTAIYFGTMGAVVAAFLLVQILLLKFAPFEEVEAKEDTSEPAENADTTKQAESKPTGEAGGDNSQYTAEQLELMALYDSYVKQNAEDGTEDPSAPAKVVEAPVPEEICIHTPAKNWKNYVPGVYDFKCENCGKTITFSVARKKKLNLILLAFSSVILMASFSSNDFPFWALILMSLGVLAVCSVVQYFFVKNSVFETKPDNVR